MRVAIAAALALLASCGGEVTEIVLVVDTDLPAASFRVEAAYPRGGMGVSTADLSEQPPPRRLVLVHEGGPLGPVALRIAALDAGGAPLAAVRRDVTFEPGRSLTLVVRLDGACATASCAASETCGNDGTCRAAAVDACEYEGRTCDVDAGADPDAGPRDAGPLDAGRDDAGPGDAGPTDAGACPAICGAPERALPGDRILPAPCAPGPSHRLEVTDGAGGPITSAGGYLLPAPGRYAVRLIQDGCEDAVAAVEVVARSGPTTALAGTTPLRDLAAGAGAAFVVGAEGAFAADTTRWYDLRSAAIASGDVAEVDLSAVAVVDGLAYVGPLADRDVVWRIDVAPDVVSAMHTRIPIGGGNRRVHGLAARTPATGPLAIACGDVTVLEDPAGAATPRDLEPGYEPQGWIALGAREHAHVGAVWAGRPDELVNRALGAGLAYGGGRVVSAPSEVGPIAAAVVDDASGIELWLCGDMELQRISLPDVDWSGADTLPAAAVRIPVSCSDVALGEGGDVWVAAAGAGLLRFARDGTRRASIAAPVDLPAGASIDRVAFAAEGGVREVWALDAAARRVHRFSTQP